jgi:very-short-patch-repair endonuclease
MAAIGAVLEQAGHQFGVIDRTGLASLGVTRSQLRGMRRAGVLLPIGTSTFRVAGTDDPWATTMAAILEVGGVASHQTAARRHGLGRWPVLHHPHILVRREGTPRHGLDFASVHTTTWLPADDLIEVDGIRCTSVARTLLLLAAPRHGIADGHLRDLVDEAIRDDKATDAWLWWRLERLRRRGRSGIQRMEEVLNQRAGGQRTESWLERTFLALLAEHDLPLPRCQQRIDLRGAFVGRVDFVYEHRRLVVEVSGHEFHASRDQLARDALRRNQLQLAGYRVLEFTYDQIVREPHAVIGLLAEALGIPR